MTQVTERELVTAKMEAYFNNVLLPAQEQVMLPSAHKIPTPKALVDELVEYAAIATVGPVDALVLFNIEFVLGLLQAKKLGEIELNSITFMSDDPWKTKTAKTLGCNVVSNISSDMKGKFTAVLQNPAYKQGLFRKFMEKGLDCLAPGGVMVQVSPDERGQLNRKNDVTKKLMSEGGLQEVLASAHHFKNVTTSTPIVTYIFIKGEATNPVALEPVMTDADKLTMSIINKIAAKKDELGGFEVRSAGVKQTGVNEITALKTVAVTGAKIMTMTANKTRFIDDVKGLMIVNRFFNCQTSASKAFKATEALYTSNDILTIYGTEGYTAEEFETLFTNDIMKFYTRSLGGWKHFCLGWTLSEMPKIPTNTTDLVEFFGLTTEEVAHIESSLTK